MIHNVVTATDANAPTENDQSRKRSKISSHTEHREDNGHDSAILDVVSHTRPYLL